jgi:hypothetical protein
MKKLNPGAIVPALLVLSLWPRPMPALAVQSDRVMLAQAVTSQPRGAEVNEALLGDQYINQKDRFTIRPPAQWWMDERNPRFAVKFSSRTYEAFIIIDVVTVPGAARMDEEFQKFINQKNKEVKEYIPGYQALSNRAVKVGNLIAYRTESSFQAGPNKVLMNVYYTNSKNKIFMITTVCPEATARKWEPFFTASLATFVPLQ